MNRALLTRLILFFIVAILGLYYILFDAVGIKIIDQPFHVRVILPSAGLVYDDAYVTYRGVDVGKVSSLQLEPAQVVATLAINDGTKIPANAFASVRELTAVGEQYLDLVPANSDPPYLHSGSVIPEDRTSVPVSVGTALDSVNALVDSLHASDLNTLTEALSQGLQGAGQDLRTIIVQGANLLNALRSATPAQVQIIDAGNTVLNTFNDTSGEFASLANNLNLLTQQVKESNTSLQELIHNGASASTNLDSLLQQDGRSTYQLIDNLAAITDAAAENQPAVQTLFEILPLFATDAASVTSGGQVRFDLDFNYANTVCPYTSTMVEPTSLVAAADLTRNCSSQAPDLLQRGAAKAPPPQG